MIVMRYSKSFVKAVSKYLGVVDSPLLLWRWETAKKALCMLPWCELLTSWHFCCRTLIKSTRIVWKQALWHSDRHLTAKAISRWLMGGSTYSWTKGWLTSWDVVMFLGAPHNLKAAQCRNAENNCQLRIRPGSNWKCSTSKNKPSDYKMVTWSEDIFQKKTFEGWKCLKKC